MPQSVSGGVITDRAWAIACQTDGAGRLGRALADYADADCVARRLDEETGAAAPTVGWPFLL